MAVHLVVMMEDLMVLSLVAMMEDLMVAMMEY